MWKRARWIKWIIKLNGSNTTPLAFLVYVKANHIDKDYQHKTKRNHDKNGPQEYSCKKMAILQETMI